MASRRGKLVAGSAAGVGLATLLAAALVFKQPILERWHLRELELGDEERVQAALRWLAENGSERALQGLADYYGRTWPQLLLVTSDMPRDLRRTILPREVLDDYMRSKAFIKARGKIQARIGLERSGKVYLAILRDPQAGSRVRIVVAHWILYWSDIGLLDREGKELAVESLSQGLSHPDSLIRAGAAIDLSEWGEAARGAVPALTALRYDQDELVRAAAAHALKRIPRPTK